MFRSLAAAKSPAQVFTYSSIELAQHLERIWARRVAARRNRSQTPGRPAPFIPGAADRIGAVGATNWRHLIYAYLIERTGIATAMERVLHECIHGERLGVLSPASWLWLKNTEDLFFKDLTPSGIGSVISTIRPDIKATRRNAYFRLLGMTIDDVDGTAVDFVRAEPANEQFTTTFEEFLREAWIGVENDRNMIGADPTDDQAIANLARRLHDMLNDRRQFSGLAREEFAANAMMSWFHLTVEFNSPIIRDLNAMGTSEEQALSKLAEKVGVTLQGNVDALFRLADPAEQLLKTVEAGVFNNAAVVPQLYQRNAAFRPQIQQVVDYWSRAFDRDLKARRTTRRA